MNKAILICITVVRILTWFKRIPIIKNEIKTRCHGISYIHNLISYKYTKCRFIIIQFNNTFNPEAAIREVGHRFKFSAYKLTLLPFKIAKGLDLMVYLWNEMKRPARKL